ncbi:MAG: lipoate--protein ligase family protein [Candidatus Firestonebacteria bacterium]
MYKTRLLLSGFNNGYTNMAIDEAVFASQRENPSLFTLRLYGWKPATISLGYFQEPAQVLNFEKLNLYNVGYVKRPTGGDAIFHDAEVTYSVITPLEYILNTTISSDNDVDIATPYKIILGGILKGLELLGLNANLRGQKIFSEFQHPYCFANNSAFDIVASEKKLVGSAQRRSKKVVMQHGSIPLKFDIDKMFECLKAKSEKERQFLKNDYLKKVTSLEAELHRALTYEEVVQYIAKGWENHFNIKFEIEETTESKIDGLTETETNLVDKFSQKYKPAIDCKSDFK